MQVPYVHLEPDTESPTVVTGIPVQPTRSGFVSARQIPQNNFTDQISRPFENCCCCFSLKQGVIIISCFSILASLSYMGAIIGFDFLIKHWDTVIQEYRDQQQDPPDSSSSNMAMSDSSETSTDELDAVHQNLLSYEGVYIFLLVLAMLFYFGKGLSGLVGSCRSNKKASKIFFGFSVASTVLEAIINVGGSVFSWAIAVLIQLYFAKVAWSWCKRLEQPVTNGVMIELPSHVTAQSL